MRVFQLFELVVLTAFLLLVANLIRYFFFRETYGGGIWGLSDKWIKRDKEKGKNR